MAVDIYISGIWLPGLGGTLGLFRPVGEDAANGHGAGVAGAWNPAEQRHQGCEIVTSLYRVPRLPGPAPELNACFQRAWVVGTFDPFTVRQQASELFPDSGSVACLPVK
jgi:hypothetical protein